MRASIRNPAIRITLLIGLASSVAGFLPRAALAADARGPIDSVEKADAALAANSGAKLRVEQQYKAATRECMTKFMVNDCVEEARTLRRDRLAEIDAALLEANRYKRRDKADRIEAERARREAVRAANASADAEQRAKNRENYEGKQAEAQRDAAERARTNASRARRTPTPHGSLVKGVKPGSAEADAAQRAKNAAEQAAKVRDAAAHREQLARRHAEKEADRARRAKQQAEKEAERKAAQNAAGATAAPKR